MQLMSFLLNSVIQLLLFSLIPFLWWLASGRKKQSFFKWIGLKKPVIKNYTHILLIFLISLLLFIISGWMIAYKVGSLHLATAQFSGLGLSGLGLVFIYSFIQTGLSEEIFFRGFLTKRFCSKWGFAAGNMIQAIIFGGLHGAMVFSFTNFFVTIIVIIFTGTIGWLLGWMNECKAGGSIIPSWLLHSFSNLIMGLLVLFNIL